VTAWTRQFFQTSLCNDNHVDNPDEDRVLNSSYQFHERQPQHFLSTITLLLKRGSTLASFAGVTYSTFGHQDLHLQSFCCQYYVRLPLRRRQDHQRGH
jgi:hypothetical protein